MTEDTGGPLNLNKPEPTPWDAKSFSRRIQDIGRAIRQALRGRDSGETPQLVTSGSGVNALIVAEGLSAVATEIRLAREAFEKYADGRGTPNDSS